MKYETELKMVMDMFRLSKRNAASFSYCEMCEAKVTNWEAFNKRLDSMTEEELYSAFDEEYALHDHTGDLFDMSNKGPLQCQKNDR